MVTVESNGANSRPNSGQHVSVVDSDLCIVGAGIAGLNALFVASQYLSPQQRVVLVDRRDRPGGMWVDTYEYVRLHQPYGMFTAGNLEWQRHWDRSYLAGKGDVLEHMERCLDELATRLSVETFFGWEFDLQHEEKAGVVCFCRSAAGDRMQIRTERLILAYGQRVSPNEPIVLSSSKVRSVSPDTCDVRANSMRASDAPVWIVGGGKTAMDTAHALITHYPKRHVGMIAGSGTFFTRRDQFFPPGVRRWWSGRPVSRLGAEAARVFDGNNELLTWERIRTKYGLFLDPRASNFMLGMLSEAEGRTIKSGLSELILDHLVDVADGADGSPCILFRSGAKQPVELGSWFVNCTGYLNRGANHPYEPYISEGGSVLSIQPRSATMHVTSVMAYFLTHLFLRGDITSVPLYELDMYELQAKSKTVFPFAVMSLAQHNLSLIYEVVPKSVLLECGLDLDRWFPITRRASDAARFALTHRRQREHQRQSLDIVRERFAVRCGPLQHVAGLQ